MKYTEAKNITKLIDAKLKKEAIKEKKRIKEEEKELNAFNENDYTEDPQIEYTEGNTYSTQKKLFLGGLVIVATGSVLYIKNKKASK